MRTLLAIFLLVFSASNVWADSRCQEKFGFWWTKVIQCSSESMSVKLAGNDTRKVLYQVPDGVPPSAGWPVVFIYQGSFMPIEFSGRSNQFFGGFNQIRVIRALLDNGYAVIAPRAYQGRFWDTNTVKITSYEQTADYKYFNILFDKIEQGEFGYLNADQMYAAGMSSGGYNASRMAVSFPGKFKALAIQSASYATCAGAACFIPRLPEDHPPTLMLHGTRDGIVPINTMNAYYDRLYAQGVPVHKVTDAVGHQWMNAGPDEILNWFMMYP